MMRTRGSMITAGKSDGTASAVAVASSPPATIWPSPPMLMTLARNAIVMPTPTKSSGVALRAVDISAWPLPNAPRNISWNPSTGLASRSTSMIAPMRSAATTERMGTR